MEKLVVTRRKGGSFESRSQQAHPLQPRHASQGKESNWYGVGVPLERRGKRPTTPTQGSNWHHQAISNRGCGKQRSRPASLSPQRAEGIAAPQIDHVWGAYQPLHQSRIATSVEVSTKRKQVLHQEL